MRIRGTKPEFWKSGRLSSVDKASWKQWGLAGPGGDFLYRLYDAEMNLLYVGYTWNPFSRWTAHSRSKPWWHEVAHADLWHCPTTRDVRHWETWCIKNLDPKYNIHQHPRRFLDG